MESKLMLIKRVGNTGSFECKEYIVDATDAVLMGDSEMDYLVGVILAGKRVNGEWDQSNWATDPRIFNKKKFKFVAFVQRVSANNALPLGFDFI